MPGTRIILTLLILLVLCPTYSARAEPIINGPEVNIAAESPQDGGILRFGIVVLFPKACFMRGHFIEMLPEGMSSGRIEITYTPNEECPLHEEMLDEEYTAYRYSYTMLVTPGVWTIDARLDRVSDSKPVWYKYGEPLEHGFNHSLFMPFLRGEVAP